MKTGYKLNNVLWSLRKIRLPINAGDLVLDVGAGNNPHPAADVLLEKYVDQPLRNDPLVADRPTVLADACKMPFKDKAFDFILAFHILEHQHNPAALIEELQRVGKAGYIETPNAIFERLFPYNDHLLEIMSVDGVLRINKKASARPDSFLNEFNLITKNAQWRKVFYGNPFLFHARHTWRGTIRYEIMNTTTSTDWFADPDLGINRRSKLNTRKKIDDLRGLGLAIIRKWFSIRKRKVEIDQMLVCPDCHGDLQADLDYYRCPVCRTRYFRRPIPDFTKSV